LRRLLLVRHASTAATRAFAFPRDEPLDAPGQAAAAALGAALPRAELRCGPALRCRETAAAAGLAAAEDPALADCDYGTWAGRPLEQLRADEAAAWRGDPDAAPHGGETLRAFATRIAGWLEAEAGDDGAVAAITDAGVVRAAVVHALAAPLAAFWRIDVAPLSITELHAHDGRWTVTRVNHPVAA
jgi:broad specificity phosphatase PhoE